MIVLNAEEWGKTGLHILLGGAGVSTWFVHSNGNTYCNLGNGVNTGFSLVWDGVNNGYFVLVDRASGREFSIPFTPL